MKNKLLKKTTKLYRFSAEKASGFPTGTGGDPTNTTITVLTTISRVGPVQNRTRK